jgi:hypothetical protein
MIRLHRPDCPHPRALEDGNYKHPTNKAALAASTSGKCMYCEAKISHISFGHVEHFMPKGPQHFPDLEFVWGNLGYACDRCNVKKASKYNAELPFIDPYSEDPGDNLLAYGPFLWAKRGSERGELTIVEIGLNRSDLVEQRSARIKSIFAAFAAASRVNNEALRESAIAELMNEALADKEYSFVVAAALQAFKT